MPPAKRQKDVQAVKAIHSVLVNLDPGTRTRVLRAVGALLQMPDAAPVGTPGAGGAPSPAGTGQQIPADLQNLNIAAFVTSKRPADTYQRLACLAYYLEQREGKTDIFAKDLTKANTDARQLRISNIATFLDLATRRHGFFTAAGRGKKRLSARATAVVEALPDQAAVKVALQQHRMPKKGGRKAKGRRRTQS